MEPSVRIGSEVEFDYPHQGQPQHRKGVVETIGNGPGGPFVTLEQEDGSYKNFSIPKIQNIREVALS